MDADILAGETVRLAAIEPGDIPMLATLYRDAGLLRMWDAEVAYPMTEARLTRRIADAQKSSNGYVFTVRRMDDNGIVGFLELDGILWTHRTAAISIGIGDRTNWGKGYGHEAMELALRFAFDELNLHRVQLTVFSYNWRAIALYESLGFRLEGSFREFLERDGQRYDMLLYGLLRREWAPPDQSSGSARAT
jgi:RimJ/RimL family protein N-acetyltransferase